MSLDHSRRRRSISPPHSSGRSSPLPGLRHSRRQLEDEPPKQDKLHRRYASQIERALAHFDSAHLEWPDYITFLGRLLKAVQAHPPKLETLPRQYEICDRLAQCLNPTLPSGVHKKALDVYVFLFDLIGREALAENLAIFLPGLTSVLTFASLSIRPTYLTLLEDHILCLEAATLRPAAKALLLTLLPGIEDETSEDFEQNLRTVNQLRGAINTGSGDSVARDNGFGDEFFWQSLFLASISSKSRRGGALVYMMRYLPKLSPATSSAKEGEDPCNDTNSASLRLVHSVISPEPGLLIRCFTTGLEDEQPLLQRGFLDLLVSRIPLDSPVLVERVEKKDLERLITAAVKIVAKRDMSLNRRLWSWFLGPTLVEEDESEPHTVSPGGPGSAHLSNQRSRALEYFRSYGLQPLTSSIVSMFGVSHQNLSEQARPFRICLSLMDRSEIGTALIPEVFAPAISSLLAWNEVASARDYQEVLKSARGFLDGVETSLIWRQITRLVTQALSDRDVEVVKRERNLKVISFILANFSVAAEDMALNHVHLTGLLAMRLVNAGHGAGLSAKSQHITLTVIDQLVSLMPDSGTLNIASEDRPQSSDATADHQGTDDVDASIIAFSEASPNGASTVAPPFSLARTIELLYNAGTSLLRPIPGMSMTDDAAADLRVCIMADLLPKLSFDYISDFAELYSVCEGMSYVMGAKGEVSPTRLFANGRLLVSAMTKSPSSARTPEARKLVRTVCNGLWELLAPRTPRYHVDAVRCLSDIYVLQPDGFLLQSMFATSIQSELSSNEIKAAQIFAVFWRHHMTSAVVTGRRSSTWTSRDHSSLTRSLTSSSDVLQIIERPLFILLDSLQTESSSIRTFVSDWIRASEVLPVIVDILIARLRAASSVSSKRRSIKRRTRQSGNGCEDQVPLARTLYNLRTLVSVLRVSVDQSWPILNACLGQGETMEDDIDAQDSRYKVIIDHCLIIMQTGIPPMGSHDETATMAALVILEVLQLMSKNPNLGAEDALNAQYSLTEMMSKLDEDNLPASAVQSALLETVLVYVRLNHTPQSSHFRGHRRQQSSLDQPNISHKATVGDQAGLQNDENPQVPMTAPPKSLLKCLQRYLAASSPKLIVEYWINCLVQVLPFYGVTLLEDLLPLVDVICKRISMAFGELRALFDDNSESLTSIPEDTILALLGCLEHVSAIAHGRLDAAGQADTLSKTTESTPGFFGNVVSSGVLPDTTRYRPNTANSRLTVILCMQDAVRTCFEIWCWSNRAQKPESARRFDIASRTYMALKLRSRSRRLLDRLFVAEPLECLETLIAANVVMQRAPNVADNACITLLHTLDGARPKRAIPAFFNALYSRTNPNALDNARMSTLTNDIRDVEIASILIEYTQSLDDDAMDEIWNDCINFLKDVLSSHMQHGTILPLLLVFLITLAEKIGKTNFGEQKRMRKELGDIFLRLLTSLLTTKSGTIWNEKSVKSPNEVSALRSIPGGSGTDKILLSSATITEIMVLVVPKLHTVVAEPERISSALAVIISHCCSPPIHSKSFPETVSLPTLRLLSKIADVPSAIKIWRRDVNDLYNHAKIFSCDMAVVPEGLIPVVRQWALHEPKSVPEICSRITTPTSAGIMFGVGASAARLDADKKAQLNFRRISLLILSSGIDFAALHVSVLVGKVTELFTATPSSSPSSSSRGDVYMAVQAIILKTSPIHLVSLWPPIVREIEKAINSVISGSKDYDTYSVPSLLQACKLLDLLLLIAPDEFQTHAWLFITDTIDAVYRPSPWEPVGVVDDVAEELGAGEDAEQRSTQNLTFPSTSSKRDHQRRGSLLTPSRAVRDLSKQDFVRTLLKPFFAQLSIHNYEAIYSLTSPDIEACEQALLDDLFDDSTLVG